MNSTPMRRAVGAARGCPASARMLPNSRPEHIVDEDRAVVVGSGEAVVRRRRVRRGPRRLGDAERVEIGVQMAAHAVGADQHDGAHRIARRLVHVGVGEHDAVGDRLVLDLASPDASRRCPSCRRAPRPARHRRRSRRSRVRQERPRQFCLGRGIVLQPGDLSMLRWPTVGSARSAPGDRRYRRRGRCQAPDRASRRLLDWRPGDLNFGAWNTAHVPAR